MHFCRFLRLSIICIPDMDIIKASQEGPEWLNGTSVELFSMNKYKVKRMVIAYFAVLMGLSLKTACIFNIFMYKQHF